MKLCVRGGTIIDPVNNFFGTGTIWTDGGVIMGVEVGEHSAGDEYEVIDARGKWVAPAFLDLHVHLREPGAEYKEDIESGCRAAKNGGFTKICCMPNTNPVTDRKEAVSYIKSKASSVKGVEVFVIGAATKGQMGKELSDIKGMAAEGICAVSEDGKSVMNSALMRDVMLECRKFGLTFFSHAEDENLAGLPIGEELIIARDILLAKETGCRLHLCHVSTEGSCDLIRKAKACGINVTAETAPHYFTLDERSVKRDANKKMNPPLRTAKDVAAVKEALKDKTIDVIATDHAPHARFEKEVEFDNAPNGVIGLETSFAVSYTGLVKTGILTPLELISKMSSRPAEILGIKPTGISAGQPADIVLIDVDEEYIIDSKDFCSKSVNSPFTGMRVYGRPVILGEKKEKK